MREFASSGRVPTTAARPAFPHTTDPSLSPLLRSLPRGCPAAAATLRGGRGVTARRGDHGHGVACSRDDVVGSCGRSSGGGEGCREHLEGHSCARNVTGGPGTVVKRGGYPDRTMIAAVRAKRFLDTSRCQLRRSRAGDVPERRPSASTSCSVSRSPRPQLRSAPGSLHR